jgi:hypothetical protein
MTLKVFNTHLGGNNRVACCIAYAILRAGLRLFCNWWEGTFSSGSEDYLADVANSEFVWYAPEYTCSKVCAARKRIIISVD